MNFVMTKINAQDAPFLSSWSRGWGYGDMDSSYWPKTGAIASYEGKPVSAAFLFKTDGKLAFIASLLSDPSGNKTTRRASFTPLVNFLTEEAEKSGYKVVVSTSKHYQFNRSLEGAGFTEHEKSVSYMTRLI